MTVIVMENWENYRTGAKKKRNPTPSPCAAIPLCREPGSCQTSLTDCLAQCNWLF